MNEFVHNCWMVLNELAPWLLLGCLVAGLIHVLIPKSFLVRHLGGRGNLSVVKAVFLGVPMPLCSCGVIPTAIGLKKQGAGDGASIGFLVSTPQTGVDSILVSASFLSWPFAIFKLLSAFVLGLVAGIVSNRFASEVELLETGDVSVEEEKRMTLREVYDFAVNDLLYMIWRWLVIGVLISAAITTWVPESVVSGWADVPLFYSLLLVLLISIPLYICATSSVPIAAALVNAGMPTSAALVFLMAGPATNFATIGAVYRAFGGRHLLVYLLTIILGSISLALCFDFVLEIDSVVMPHEHGAATSVFVYVLLVYFIIFLFKDIKSALFSKKPMVGDILEFDVDGLTCQGCVKKLKASLGEVPGVQGIDILLDTGHVKLSGIDIDYEKITFSVKKIGFRLRQPLS